MNESSVKPLVISVVSGKGGVGKTRISTTLAKILSKNLKVLMIDFDLHNQGLTSLLYGSEGVNKFESSIFDYLYDKEDIDIKDVKLREIKNNLFFLAASLHATRNMPVRLENLDNKYTSDALSEALLKLIHKVKSNYSIDCIIIDNTGIPDDFSIGSSLVADKILLITQTDSVTWRGALNFYRIFVNNKGDPNKIKFVVNNIPKKYNFELVDFETKEIGEFLRGLDFEIFIPFEYGVFESADKNIFSDKNIEKSLFYKKIELLSVTLLKESKLDKFVSKELEAIFDEKITIRKSLDVRLESSPEYKKRELIFRIFVSTIFAVMGVIFTSAFFPNLIPQFLKDINYNIIIQTLIILIVFSASIMALVAPKKLFRLMEFLESRR